MMTPETGDPIKGSGGFRVLHATRRSPERWWVLATDGDNWTVWRNLSWATEESGVPSGWYASGGHYFEENVLSAMERYVQFVREGE